MKHTRNQAGFTLVELSIVLVIIGLIVSGVLVGQDMIRAAEIRSTVGQIESYNTAVNTFRDKYRNLPGDMVSSDATRFGFVTRAGTAGQGDGDRILEGGAAGALFGHETALFWVDLAQAALVDGGFNTATDALGNGGAAITTADMDDFMPGADIGLGHYITVFSSGGRNFFQIARVTDVAAAGTYTLETAMTPQIAFNIDDKLDDGNPANGTVRAAYSATLLNAIVGVGQIDDTGAAPDAFTPSGTGSTDCASDPTTADEFAYATTTEDFANQPACQLRIRAAF